MARAGNELDGGPSPRRRRRRHTSPKARAKTAARVRSSRGKHAAGLIYAALWLDEANLIASLEGAGRLTGNDADDPKKIIAALQEAINDLIAPK